LLSDLGIIGTVRQEGGGKEGLARGECAMFVGD